MPAQSKVGWVEVSRKVLDGGPLVKSNGVLSLAEILFPLVRGLVLSEKSAFGVLRSQSKFLPGIFALKRFWR